jgi:EAL domain-containing protein (putative c-di-GMP-specific phosphodiesterase class I)
VSQTVAGGTQGATEREATRTFLRLAHPAPINPGDMPGRVGRPTWILESLAEGSEDLRRMPIQPLPFRIGRRPGLELVLPPNRVSNIHAEIYEQAGTLWICDHQSRNGTYVNHRAVTQAEITEGDILHFGDFEFRIGRETVAEEAQDSSATATYSPFSLSRQFLEGARDLKDLLRDGTVTVEFQPIVRLPGGNVTCYEALGRGAHPARPKDPVELFKVAESIGAEIELSRLLRRRAVELVAAHPVVSSLFLNTHPSELRNPGLIESMEELRGLAPHLDLTLEIHESALAHPSAIAALRDHLSEINVGLAYDDFGSGQARLLELAEAPPHYLKFDRRFVTNIDQAPPSRRRLLASLVAASRELLVKTVAEGIETPAEAEVCARLGFTLAQGFHYGRPVNVESL